MKKFALTGVSISHSKSPKLFLAAYPNRFDYSYELMPALSAEEAIILFRKNELSGMNVTAPFKSDILQYVDWCSNEVKIIGAANVIVLQNEKLCAYNTDAIGVSDSFIHSGVELKNENVIVLGAGGAAQAAIYALKQAGANIFCANRTEEKAEQLAKKIGISFLPTDNLNNQLQECRLLVNTLPANADLYHKFNLHKHNVVLDANYNECPLHEKATLSNANYISGLSWILYQAIPSYFLFTGEMPDIEAMKEFLKSQK